MVQKIVNEIRNNEQMKGIVDTLITIFGSLNVKKSSRSSSCRTG